MDKDAGIVAPQFLRLRVQGGLVFLSNGFTFWQELAQCRWATRTKYMPVTCEGIPVSLIENLPILEKKNP